MQGRRYPLGIQTFKNVIEENYIYVDNTPRDANIRWQNRHSAEDEAQHLRIGVEIQKGGRDGDGANRAQGLRCHLRR